MTFESAFKKIHAIFQRQAENGDLSDRDIEDFNQAQKVIIDYYNANEGKNKQDVKMPWDSEEFKEIWSLWKKYKRQQFNFTYKPIGEQAALKKLAEMSSGNMEVAKAIIWQSIENGWKGLFQLNKKRGKAVADRKNIDYKASIVERLMGNNHE